MFDLSMDSVEVYFDQFMLRFFFIGSVLAKLIQNIERLLANIHLKIVPVVIPHEILQFVPGKYFSQLAE
jgi:hypothetical protein